MPSLKLNGGTTDFAFKVVDYQKYNAEKNNILWCDVILNVKNYYMNFGKKFNDIILNTELEQLIDKLYSYRIIHY